MKKILALALAAATLAAPAFAGSGSQRVIVTFKAGTAPGARAQALRQMGARPVASILSSDPNRAFVAVVAEVPPKQTGLIETLRSAMGLSQAPAGSSVLNVEPDYRVKWIEEAPAAFTLNRGGALESLGLPRFSWSKPVRAMARRGEITWGIARVDAPAAWDYTEGAGVRVAVIDTGIDTTHPDLQGKVDGGYNAITGSQAPGSYVDDNGHGTHVAGIIAAIRDGKGVVGVAPKARLYAVKVLDADGTGSLSDVIKGIIWAADNGMQVANMSLGSPQGSAAMEEALRYAEARGVVVVAAAGNSGASVGYPGAYPETIAVSASDWNDQLASFSSRGPQVKFIAPGVDIVSTYLGGGYLSLSGTSMATPFVTGMAALAVSQGWRGLGGPDGVLAQLEKAATPLPGLDANAQGYGMIDAGKLVRTADVATAP